MEDENRRILIIDAIGEGEFLAELALAMALKRRGCRVGFVTRLQNEQTLQKLGLDFVEYGGDIARVPSRRKGAPLPTSGNWVRQGLDRWRSKGQIAINSIEWPFKFIREQHEKGDLLVIARFNLLGARLAREKLGVPVVSLHLQPAVLRSRFYEPGLPVPNGNLLPLRWARSLCWRGIDAVIDTHVEPSLNQFRKAIGLVPVRRPFNFWVYSPDLNLGLFPEWYGPPQPDWPATTVLTGFPILAQEDTAGIPDDVAHFFSSGASPVIFTQGSHAAIADPFFHVAVEACQKLGLRGVLAGVGPKSNIENLPDSVMSCAFVPFNKMLPLAAAIVHHGGIGTTAQSLWAGIPQVIVPMFDDQFYNARRVGQLGAGQRLSKRKFTATTLAGALQRVLGSQRTVQRCREIASWMRQRDPMEEACHHIEQYWEQARTKGLPRPTGNSVNSRRQPP